LALSERADGKVSFEECSGQLLTLLGRKVGHCGNVVRLKISAGGFADRFGRDYLESGILAIQETHLV